MPLMEDIEDIESMFPTNARKCQRQKYMLGQNIAGMSSISGNSPSTTRATDKLNSDAALSSRGDRRSTLSCFDRLMRLVVALPKGSEVEDAARCGCTSPLGKKLGPGWGSSSEGNSHRRIWPEIALCMASFLR